MRSYCCLDEQVLIGDLYPFYPSSLEGPEIVGQNCADISLLYKLGRTVFEVWQFGVLSVGFYSPLTPPHSFTIGLITWKYIYTASVPKDHTAQTWSQSVEISWRKYNSFPKNGRGIIRMRQCPVGKQWFGRSGTSELIKVPKLIKVSTVTPATPLIHRTDRTSGSRRDLET